MLRIGLLGAALYAAVFALLALDAAARVWIMRAAFETQLDVGFLLVYEGMRVLTIALAATMASVLAIRARPRGPAALAALLVVLLAVVYAKTTTYAGFAGFVQERVARALLSGGTPQELLRIVFAEPAWAIVLAGAAFLRLATSYPEGVTPEAVLAAGRTDRQGMLRGSAVAGADIGAMARRMAAGALRWRLLAPLPVWTGALALAALTLVDGPAADVALGAGVGLPLLVGVPALRASLARAAEADRARILWFVEAALLAAVAFVVGGLLSLVPGTVAGGLSFVVLAVAPTVVLLCLATALAPAGGVEPQRALRVTAHVGATATTAVALFALLHALLAPAFADTSVLPGTLALLAAAAVAAPAHRRLRAPAAKLTGSALTPAAAGH